MARPCIICTHDKRQEIDAALVKGTGIDTVSKRFGITKSCVYRHLKTHLHKQVAKATVKREAKNVLTAEYLQQQLAKNLEYTNKLHDACDAWLTDPANKEKYTLEPRSSELDVVYLDENTEGQMVRVKAPLSELIEKTGKTVVSWESKRADPRDLILKAHARLDKSMELIGRLIGLLQEQATVNLTVNLTEITAAFIESAAGYPEIIAKAKARLAELKGESDGTIRKITA